MFPVRSYPTIEEFTNPLWRKWLEGSNGFAIGRIDGGDCQHYLAGSKSRFAVRRTGSVGSVRSMSCQGTS